MTSITPRAGALPEPGVGDHPALARALLREALTGSLATLDPAGGHPFVSLVTVATDFDGAPLLLLSRLALHSRNMAADGRVSLLLARGGKGDPLAHPRLTLSGTAAPAEAPHLRGRFLARHPKAALYADFPDFRFWRIEPSAAHLVAGFGRAPELPPSALRTDTRGGELLLAAEPDALALINVDDIAAVAGMPGDWRLCGLDPDGMDLLDGDRALRVPFPTRVTDPAMLRATLAAMAR